MISLSNSRTILERLDYPLESRKALRFINSYVLCNGDDKSYMVPGESISFSLNMIIDLAYMTYINLRNVPANLPRQRRGPLRATKDGTTRPGARCRVSHPAQLSKGYCSCRDLCLVSTSSEPTNRL